MSINWGRQYRNKAVSSYLLTVILRGQGWSSARCVSIPSNWGERLTRTKQHFIAAGSRMQDQDLGLAENQAEISSETQSNGQASWNTKVWLRAQGHINALREAWSPWTPSRIGPNWPLSLQQAEQDWGRRAALVSTDKSCHTREKAWPGMRNLAKSCLNGGPCLFKVPTQKPYERKGVCAWKNLCKNNIIN